MTKLLLPHVRGSFQVHPYHLIESSPWPLGALVTCLILTLGGIVFHGFGAGDIALIKSELIRFDYEFLSLPFICKHTFDSRILGEVTPSYHFKDLTNYHPTIGVLKNKSGIYLWFNKVTGLYYVGSGICLYTRLLAYQQPSYLNSTTESRIINAMRKYDISCWELIIIEIVDPEDCPEGIEFGKFLTHLETYWIQELKSAYNINQEGSSRFGSKHSEETKKLIGSYHKGKTLSPEHKQKLKDSGGFKGKSHTDESKKLISEKLSKIKNKSTYKFDKENGTLIKVYSSKKEAALDNGLSPSTLGEKILNGVSVNGFFYTYNSNGSTSKVLGRETKSKRSKKA